MCTNLIVNDITVRCPDYAQNSDGIDIESCRNVVLTGSRFDVGDDGICIKSGKDKAGRDRGIPGENILVDNCIVFTATAASSSAARCRAACATSGFRTASFGYRRAAFKSNARPRRGGGAHLDRGYFHERHLAGTAAVRPFLRRQIGLRGACRGAGGRAHRPGAPGC
ncbi:MAG: glycosyl hydrolase family 28 protein [Alistipes shahii]|uniref:glycosyl hydrolase family 28 protein n=1 Tax=Alistipes shahii TaxID=328814 RepID=UPI00399D51FF